MSKMRTTHRAAAAVVSTAAVAIIAASCAAGTGSTPAPRVPAVHVVQYQPPDVLKTSTSSGGAGLSGLHVPHPRLHVLRRPYLFRRHYLFRFGSRRNSNG